eukprot:GHVS01080651.1.p1 GENE.GHVS01080651.1~~GHVS01080651.1.p1  ORF type:complete len:347 (-),score=68.61 GHVS01080651.1:272-1312(-)
MAPIRLCKQCTVHPPPLTTTPGIANQPTTYNQKTSTTSTDNNNSTTSTNASVVITTYTTCVSNNVKCNKLVVVVGCASGFGRAIVEGAYHIIGPSHYVLLGKNVDGMVCVSKSLAGASSVSVDLLDMNSRAMDVGKAFELAMAAVTEKELSHIYLFLNSGSFEAGHLTDTLELIESAVSLNVIGFHVIVAKFMQWTKQYISRHHLSSSFRLINISSLLATIPLVGCGIYCATKAYRQAIIGVASLEATQIFDNFKCLNWAPGPMDTDMMNHVRSSNVDEVKNIAASGPYVCANRSACMLWRLLVEDEYKSGDHVDIYDVIEPEHQQQQHQQQHHQQHQHHQQQTDV